MKKIFMSTLLLASMSTASFAEEFTAPTADEPIKESKEFEAKSDFVNRSSIFIGIDYMVNSTSVDISNNFGYSNSIDNDSAGYKIKFGSASSTGSKYQIYYLSETADEKLFDNTNDTLNEIGLDYSYGFEVTPQFSPFINFGFGYAFMDVDPTLYNADSIAAVSLRVGVGASYMITDNFEVLGGLDYQFRSWQEISFGSVTVNTEETSTKLYLGGNFHF